MEKQNKYPKLTAENLQNDHLKGFNFEKNGNKRNSAFHWFIQINSTIPNIVNLGKSNSFDTNLTKDNWVTDFINKKLKK